MVRDFTEDVFDIIEYFTIMRLPSHKILREKCQPVHVILASVI